MPIQKIISGGQTGVDRAALDVALEMGLSCGGWCPRGRKAEDGVIPGCYPLQETPAVEYALRTEWNVRDSDGTLVLTVGPPTGGTRLTVQWAERVGRPCLVVDLADSKGRSAAISAVAEWLQTHRIKVLNVAGPRESTQPGVFDQAATFLRELLASRERERPEGIVAELARIRAASGVTA